MPDTVNSLDRTTVFVTVSTLVGVLLGGVISPWTAGWVASRARGRELNRERLEKFYSPLHSIFELNGILFQRVRIEVQDYDPDEAVRVWDSVVEKVILPNNRAMAEILATKFHLLEPGDPPEVYVRLAAHLRMYELFRQAPFESYREFQFPTEVTVGVANARRKLLRRMEG